MLWRKSVAVTRTPNIYDAFFRFWHQPSATEHVNDLVSCLRNLINDILVPLQLRITPKQQRIVAAVKRMNEHILLTCVWKHSDLFLIHTQNAAFREKYVKTMAPAAMLAAAKSTGVVGAKIAAIAPANNGGIACASD